MDSLFTIVIPYHAETKTLHFVKKQLNFYNSNPISVPIILAVSGDEHVTNELQEFIRDLNNQYFIVHIENEADIKNYNHFIKKIYEALKIVKTQYVVINGADDVIFPEMLAKGCQILENNPDVAATKGYTIAYYPDPINFLICNDQEILQKTPVKRVKEQLKDIDSMFYIIRRTEDLLRECQNINILSEKTDALRSPYHIEHFMALSAVCLGKVYVFNQPWRIFTVHKDNHSAHTPASFIRVQTRVIEKSAYEWFQSVTPNMMCLSYAYYRFLWECMQIRGISVSLKQIISNFLYKDLSVIDVFRVLTYFILNKVFRLAKILLPTKDSFRSDQEHFFKSDEFKSLKEHYFSEEEVRLIESKEL